tara:strand:- start:1198 stop:1524 length:327 start_codon:yes stop_codon:yes gene_type:complete
MLRHIKHPDQERAEQFLAHCDAARGNGGRRLRDDERIAKEFAEQCIRLHGVILALKEADTISTNALLACSRLDKRRIIELRSELDEANRLLASAGIKGAPTEQEDDSP